MHTKPNGFGRFGIGLVGLVKGLTQLGIILCTCIYLKGPIIAGFDSVFAYDFVQYSKTLEVCPKASDILNKA